MSDSSRIGAISTLVLIFLSSVMTLAQSKEVDPTLSNLSADKPTLLVFSGSDWCMPCIRLEKEILQHQRFKTFITNRLEVLKADFPQRKKQDKETVKRNESLAELYNTKGQFPMIVLLLPDHKEHRIIRYEHWSVDLFVQEITDIIKSYTHQVYEKQSILMGTRFSFSLVDTIGSLRANNLLDECVSEVRRLEHLLSEWIDTTEVARLNKNAGIQSMKVDPELYELVDRSMILSGITQGAFDITFAGLGKLWTFNGTEQSAPDSKILSEALDRVGYQKVQRTADGELFLPQKGMKIGFGGMGKGYSADKVKELMKAKGIEDGVINASGDLVAWGKPPGAEHWQIGIADPENSDRILCWLPIVNSAVATSGNYERFLIMNDERYAHIIDPKTGYPTKGIKSVTVISPSAELSDALATALFVLGLETGMDLIEQLPHAECLIIDASNELHFSSKLQYIKNES